MATKEKMTPELLASQRQSLYQQMLAETQRLAAQQASQSRTNLREQLAQQRYGQQQARSQISEQAYMQQRQIGQQASARGLGSSGIRNVAGLQSQLAQNSAVNQLAQQGNMFQREAMHAGQAINQSLGDQLRGAQLQYSQMEAQNQEQLYAQKRMDDRERADFMMQLVQLGAEGADSGLIQQLIAASGYDLSDLTASQSGLIEGLGSVGADPYGSTQILAKMAPGSGGIDFSQIGDEDINYMSPERLSELMRSGSQDGNKVYTIRGEEFTGTPEMAAMYAMEAYKKFPNIGAGKIEIKPDIYGNLRFYVGDKAAKTYEQAVKVYNERAEKQTGTK